MIFKLTKIINGCKNQNLKSQEKLYKHFFGKMMNISLRYTGNYHDASEVVNSGFFKVFNKIDSFQQKGSFENWIKRIMINTALDHIKSDKTAKELQLNIDENEFLIENETLENIDEKEIISFIQQLPPTSRAVFNLYVIEGYKHSEIAKKLDMSEGTSHWHLSNARKLLKQKIENTKK
ncbi:MAG: RNA polymerase sigma factor [Bacteroidota bacterium]|nr:RNA polymerase sigma factor [Bacteroidota bacterium]